MECMYAMQRCNNYDECIELRCDTMLQLWWKVLLMKVCTQIVFCWMSLVLIEWVLSILKSYFAIIFQKGRLMFLLNWLHFTKQKHGEVFKFSELIQDDFLVHKGYKLDTMQQHMGTTYGPFSIGQIVAFWNKFFVEDLVRFYLFYLAIWSYNFLDNVEDQIKFKWYLNLTLN